MSVPKSLFLNIVSMIKKTVSHVITHMGEIKGKCLIYNYEISAMTLEIDIFLS